LKDNYTNGKLELIHGTDLGQAYAGDSLDLMSEIESQSVNLIMTSPPFGLVRKKSYGNEDSEHYIQWIRPFAKEFKRILKEDGSLVIDLGGAWNKGLPTRSLYHFKVLITLCEEFGFHLCQEFYWWNPSKLPTPAEWVTIRRLRVKDAVNTVWWLSPSPWPRANNRRVLTPYSDSMKGLLKNGYTPRLRPSGHDISDKFQKDNNGAIPPNLIAIPNTRSTDPYKRYCEKHNLPIHPARFPAELPGYFVSFLSDPGDIVLDPFAGSCMTGAVAESMQRQWLCCDLDENFIEGGKGYFEEDFKVVSKRKSVLYQIGIPSFLTRITNLPKLTTGKKREKKGKT
jgi:DNA modification methylase